MKTEKSIADVEKIRKYKQQYYQLNRDKYLDMAKRYYWNNRTTVLSKNQEKRNLEKLQDEIGIPTEEAIQRLIEAHPAKI